MPMRDRIFKVKLLSEMDHIESYCTYDHVCLITNNVCSTKHEQPQQQQQQPKFCLLNGKYYTNSEHIFDAHPCESTTKQKINQF